MSFTITLTMLFAMFALVVTDAITKVSIFQPQIVREVVISIHLVRTRAILRPKSLPP